MIDGETHLPAIRRLRLRRMWGRPFSLEQAYALLAAAEDEGLHRQSFFMLAVLIGMRLGELRGLRWSDLDLAKAALTINQTVQYVPQHGFLTKGPKSASGRRQILLSEEMVSLLRKHRESQNEARLQHGPGWQDNDLVFPGCFGQPLIDNVIYCLYTKICRRTGIPKLRFHDLRHTAATLMLVAGVHPKVVSERLGHSNIQITLQTYSHVGETLQRQAVEHLDALLKSVSNR